MHPLVSFETTMPIVAAPLVIDKADQSLLIEKPFELDGFTMPVREMRAPFDKYASLRSEQPIKSDKE